MTDEITSDLVLLTPTCVRLCRAAPGSVTVRATVEGDPHLSPDRSYLAVRVARAFPFSRPDEYIGLRDATDKDIGTLVTLDGMDADSRRVLSEEIDRRYFMPRWERTVKVSEQFAVIEWTMQTDRGERTYFLRNIKDSVQHLSPTRVLVTDPDGNRFEVADTNALDPKAYDVLAKAL